MKSLENEAQNLISISNWGCKINRLKLQKWLLQLSSSTFNAQFCTKKKRRADIFFINTEQNPLKLYEAFMSGSLRSNLLTKEV